MSSSTISFAYLIPSTFNNNVGIGKTATATNALDVSGNVAVSGNVNIDSGLLFIDGSNNRVGIAKTNPSVALDVSGTIAATNANIPIGFRVASFTSTGSQTWTVPAGVFYLRITATAGGGSGGGAGNAIYSTGGGGAGGTARWFGSVTPGTVLTINVGSGASTTSAGNNGSTGGSTTITATGINITCNGGEGGVRGTNSPYGGYGGTSSGGSINIIGGDGGNGMNNNSYGSGNGGASIWGTGGRPGSNDSSETNVGRPGRAYGSGGGGGRWDQGGGAGANGIVIIEY